MTPGPAPPRRVGPGRVGRPSNLSKLGPQYAPAPLLPPPSQALLLVEIADVLHAAGEAIRLLADGVREPQPSPEPDVPDMWLTLSEASALAKVSRDTLVRWIKLQRLQVIREPDGQPYRPYRISRASLEGL